MPDQQQRLCPNIEQSLGECIVFSGHASQGFQTLAGDHYYTCLLSRTPVFGHKSVIVYNIVKY